MSKSSHDKFLLKMGAHPSQIKTTLKNKTKKYIPSESAKTRQGETIAPNGTKPVDSKNEFKSATHFVAPVCSKGAYQLISVADIKTAGRKI